MTPYWQDDTITLYHGDALQVLPLLPVADAIVTDPPYGETSLDWDKWPDGWPAIAARVAPQMWCFGSMRMFLDKRGDLADWKLAQDIVWEKAQRLEQRERPIPPIARVGASLLPWRVGAAFQGSAVHSRCDRTNGAPQGAAAAVGRHRRQQLCQ